MTRFDTVVITLGVALSLLVLLLLATWAVPRAILLWRTIKVGAPGDEAPDRQKTTQDSPMPPVRVTATGEWLNTGFQYEKLAMDLKHGQLYGEFLYVKLRANQRLAASSVRLTLEGPDGKPVKADLAGVFSGDVPEGKDETICVMRRRFRMADARYSEGGVDHNVKHRVDVDAVFLPDRPGKTPMSMGSIHQVRIDVFTGNGKPFVAHMTLDLRDVPAPKTRLVTWPDGNINVRIKDSFVSPTSSDF
jgi:hypothetical protein